MRDAYPSTNQKISLNFYITSALLVQIYVTVKNIARDVYLHNVLRLLYI